MLLVQKLGGVLTIQNNKAKDIGQQASGVTVTVQIPYNRGQTMISSFSNNNMSFRDNGQVPHFRKRSGSVFDISHTLETEEENLPEEPTVSLKLERYIEKETHSLSLKDIPQL